LAEHWSFVSCWAESLSFQPVVSQSPPSTPCHVASAAWPTCFIRANQRERECWEDGASGDNQCLTFQTLRTFFQSAMRAELQDDPAPRESKGQGLSLPWSGGMEPKDGQAQGVVMMGDIALVGPPVSWACPAPAVMEIFPKNSLTSQLHIYFWF
jgi:hypothetical protein